MERFTLGRWKRLQRFLEVRELGHQLAGEEQANRVRRMYSGQSLFLRSGWFGNAMPSRMARGCLSNGVDKSQGASWSEEFDDELRGALGGERDLELRRRAVSWNTVDPPFNTYYYSVIC